MVLQIILVDGAQFLHQLLEVQALEFLVLELAEQHPLVLQQFLPLEIVPVLRGVHRSPGMAVMVDDDIVGHAIGFRTPALAFNPGGFVQVDLGADGIRGTDGQVILRVLEQKVDFNKEIVCKQFSVEP